MNHFRIHPIVMGTKIFDKSMMTYQYGQGQTYTIPIYCRSMFMKRNWPASIIRIRWIFAISKITSKMWKQTDNSK